MTRLLAATALAAAVMMTPAGAGNYESTDLVYDLREHKKRCFNPYVDGGSLRPCGTS